MTNGHAGRVPSIGRRTKREDVGADCRSHFTPDLVDERGVNRWEQPGEASPGDRLLLAVRGADQPLSWGGGGGGGGLPTGGVL